MVKHLQVELFFNKPPEFSSHRISHPPMIVIKITDYSTFIIEKKSEMSINWKIDNM